MSLFPKKIKKEKFCYSFLFSFVFLQEMKRTRTFSRISPTWPPMTQKSWTATSSTSAVHPWSEGLFSQKQKLEWCPLPIHTHSEMATSKPATVSNVAKAPFHQFIFSKASASFKWRGASTMDYFFFKLCMLIGCITVSKWYSVKAFGRIHIVLNQMIITLGLNVELPSRLSLTLTELNVCCHTLWRWRTVIVFLIKLKVWCIRAAQRSKPMADF